MLLRHKFIFLFLFLLFLLPLVVAVKPVQSSTNVLGASLFIVSPKEEFFSLQNDFKLHFHVLNSTSFQLAANQVSCGLHLYNYTDSHLFSGLLLPDSNGVDVYFQVNSSYVSVVGVYSYIVFCNSSFGQYGFLSDSFEVTVDGRSNSLFPVGWLVLIIAFGLVAVLSLWVSFSLKSSGLMGVKALMFLYGLANVFLIGMFSYFISVQPSRVDLFSDVTSIFLYVNGMLLLLVILLYSVYLIKRAISRNGGGDDD
jgi:hypothetical protein